MYLIAALRKTKNQVKTVRVFRAGDIDDAVEKVDLLTGNLKKYEIKQKITLSSKHVQEFKVDDDEVEWNCVLVIEITTQSIKNLTKEG